MGERLFGQQLVNGPNRPFIEGDVVLLSVFVGGFLRLHSSARLSKAEAEDVVLNLD
jgi:hypothetical protein